MKANPVKPDLVAAEPTPDLGEQLVCNRVINVHRVSPPPSRLRHPSPARSRAPHLMYLYLRVLRVGRLGDDRVRILGPGDGCAVAVPGIPEDKITRHVVHTGPSRAT